MDEIPTLTALEPFRRDPITNFFVKRPWYVATIACIGIYLLGVGAAAIDGTLFEIPARTPPYPAGNRLIPFINEPYTAGLLLAIIPAAILYIRTLNQRIINGCAHLYESAVLDARSTHQRQQLSVLQRRFDHPASFICSVLFTGWLVAIESLARFSDMGNQLGLTLYSTAEVSRMSFIWMALMTFFISHMFVSSLFRIGITCLFISHAFDNEADVQLQPIHPDGCCGLRFVGDLTLFMSCFVVFWPVGLALLAFVHPEFLTFPAFRYGLMYTGGVFYIVVASLVFLLPTLTAHRVMNKSRNDAVTLLTERFLGTYNAIFERLHQSEIDQERLDEEVKLLENIKTLITDVSARGIWPFNLKLVTRFLTLVLAPLIPIYFEFMT